MINILQIFPVGHRAEFITIKPLGVSIASTIEELDVLRDRKKDSPLATPQVGVIEIAGRIEDLDFRQSDADRLARKTDGLAVWFGDKASMPYPGHPMGSDERAIIADWIKKSETYYHLPDLIKRIIDGIEIQLVRRVLLIGARDGDNPDQFKWMQIPKDRKGEAAKEKFELTENDRAYSVFFVPDGDGGIQGFIPWRNPITNGQEGPRTLCLIPVFANDRDSALAEANRLIQEQINEHHNLGREIPASTATTVVEIIVVKDAAIDKREKAAPSE